MNYIEEKKGYLMIFISGVLWGSIGLFVKLLKEMEASSEMISFVRLLSALIIILIFGLATEGTKVLKIGKKSLICCLIMGLFCQAIYNLAYTEAIDNVGMAMGAILLYTAPVYTAIMAKAIFKERFTKKKIFALFLNITGCVLAVTGGNFDFSQISIYGVVMGIVAALMYSMSAIIGRFAASEEGPITIAIYMFIFASVFLAVFTRPWIGCGEYLSMKFIIVGGLYGLIPTFASYVFYFSGLAKVSESGKVPVFASVETVVAVMIGIVVFSEAVSIIKFIGIVVVMASIYIMNMKAKEA